MRAGAEALSLLSVPLNVHVLEALEEGPKPLIDLRCAIGSPPQTTMRGHLRTLTRTGILERRRQAGFPGQVHFGLDGPGRDLLRVVALTRDWLSEATAGEIVLGSMAAKSTIKALLGGWTSGIVRAVAARPFSLTELNKLITALNYPSLERRLGAMRLAGLLEACPGEGVGTPYTATTWMRRAIGVLMSGALWEREHVASETAPPGRIDFESAFLLTAPLLELPENCEGTCRLAVEIRGGGGKTSFAGATLAVEDGAVVSCTARPEGHADAWVAGSVHSWLHATVDGDPNLLEIGGNGALGVNVAEALHDVQYRARQRA